MYTKPFFIEEPVSNNSFSFGKRPHKKIRVAALKNGTLDDLEQSGEIVFEDFIDEKCVSAQGLENFIQTDYKGIPVYIFDNHNHAFYFWHVEIKTGRFEKRATLVHVDQHNDTRIPDEFISAEDSKNLEKVFHYTNTVLNVGNFIPPALKNGLFKKIINVNSEDSLLNINPDYPFVLDIDIDFFAPEMDYIDNKLKIQTIKKLLPHAKLITVATSPFFINQDLAIQTIKELLS